jgi:uncharacterized protein (TIGR03000 family)
MRVLMIAALSGLALGLGVNQTLAAAEAGAPGILHVLLPADATLTIDGEKTVSTSADRHFETPALEAGKVYMCTLKAEFVRSGATVRLERKVRMRAGMQTDVIMDADGDYTSFYSASAPTTPRQIVSSPTFVPRFSVAGWYSPWTGN